MFLSGSARAFVLGLTLAEAIGAGSVSKTQRSVKMVPPPWPPLIAPPPGSSKEAWDAYNRERQSRNEEAKSEAAFLFLVFGSFVILVGAMLGSVVWSYLGFNGILGLCVIVAGYVLAYYKIKERL